MFGMFSLSFWVIRALKREVVNFPMFELAGVPIRPLKYLDMPILTIACAPCMHAHDVYAHHDITRFAYDVNHVIMTSPAVASHSCHVKMSWHDVIGVCVVETPCHHHDLRCMGMT